MVTAFDRRDFLKDARDTGLALLGLGMPAASAQQPPVGTLVSRRPGGNGSRVSPQLSSEKSAIALTIGANPNTLLANAQLSKMPLDGVTIQVITDKGPVEQVIAKQKLEWNDFAKSLETTKKFIAESDKGKKENGNPSLAKGSLAYMSLGPDLINWSDPATEANIVNTFAHTAKFAKEAGLAGLFVDLRGSKALTYTLQKGALKPPPATPLPVYMKSIETFSARVQEVMKKVAVAVEVEYPGLKLVLSNGVEAMPRGAGAADSVRTGGMFTKAVVNGLVDGNNSATICTAWGGQQPRAEADPQKVSVDYAGIQFAVTGRTGDNRRLSTNPGKYDQCVFPAQIVSLNNADPVIKTAVNLAMRHAEMVFLPVELAKLVQPKTSSAITVALGAVKDYRKEALASERAAAGGMGN